MAELDFALPLYDKARAERVQRDAVYMSELGLLIEATGGISQAVPRRRRRRKAALPASALKPRAPRPGEAEFKRRLSNLGSFHPLPR